MRTVSFQSVLHGVCDLMGLDPAQLQLNQARPLVEYINGAVRRGWEMDAWWPWVVLEERRWRPDWNAEATYDIGDEVWFAGANQYYRATTQNANAQPDTSVAEWEECSPDTWLSLSDPFWCPVGTVVAVYDSRQREYPFLLQGDRVFVGPPAPGLAVLCYTRQAPRFTAEPFDTTRNYLPGALVYVPEVGECFAAKVDTVGEYPVIFTESWEKVCFPYVLAEFVKAEAYARALETDGQTERSIVAARRAQSLIDDELDKVFLQQQQTRRFRVIY